jgi:photosystem II stability/assembly factor-like uncharacterized protein
MSLGSDTILYIGAADGLYRGEWKGNGYGARLLGLQGKGALRSPVVLDRDDGRRIYAGTAKAGVCRSDDGGQSWHEINNGIIYKEAWSILQHPKSGALFVGTGPSSVFKSVDGGDTWIDCEYLRTLPETKDWTFPNPPHISHVKGLSLHADNPDVVFAAIEEGWLVRSKDGGKTWQNIREGTEFDSHSVAIMPNNPAVVISTSGKGIFKSTDGGDHFAPANQGLDCRYLAQLVVHPKRPQVLFTAAAAVPPPFWRRPEGAASAFYRSENQGASWQKLSGGLPEHLKAAPRATAGDPEDPNMVFVGMSDGAIWMSEDGGESFRQILADLPQVMSIRVTH